jgi:hypothetical protein
MKKSYHLFLLFIVSLLLGCSKDDNNNENQSPYSMSAEIDGRLITWKSPRLSDFNDYNKNYHISALAKDNIDPDLTHSFKIYFNPTNGPRIYEFDGIENYVEYFVYRGDFFNSTIDHYYYSPAYCNDEYQMINSGKLEITSFDIILKGTFEFLATEKCETNQIHVTNGKFEIEKQL